MDATRKLWDLDGLAGELDRRRRTDRQRVVLCHGVFDLLHVGHIRHFEQAKKLGDVLVVIRPEDAALYDAAVSGRGWSLRPPVPGGATRQESVRAGLEALAVEPPEIVLIHDAARPFTDAPLIGRVIAGRSHTTTQTALGGAIVLSALYMMAVVPRAMARKWRTPPEA